MTEVEAIVNSRPLTVETLSDINSLQPLSPSQLLAMKSKVVMPPPGSFSRPDLYNRKRWRRVQHIANEFWSRWRKEFLSNLQAKCKWNKVQRNFQEGDVVLLKEDSNRCEWPMARIVKTFPDRDSKVRSVQLVLSNKLNDKKSAVILNRPIHKLVLLVESDLFPDEEP